jgi:peptidyl-dipeptidase A
MRKLGLLAPAAEDIGSVINYLYKEALDKIAFFPMALVIDNWRWDVFQGKVKPKDYNCQWWNLLRKLQGLKPPNVRRSTDFDAGSKFHVAYGKRAVYFELVTLRTRNTFDSSTKYF